jgi:glycosyltransferase involved in cell wall biosynthesis
MTATRRRIRKVNVSRDPNFQARNFVAVRLADKLAGDSPYLAALRALSIDLAKLVHEIPHVTTVHSLEPLRPRKEEQLGGGYHLSAFAERTTIEHADAVIAVSAHVKRDVLQVYPAVDAERVHVIYNGVSINEYSPDHGTDVLERYGVDPEFAAAFAERMNEPARAAAMGKAGRLRAINHFSWEVIGAETVRLYRSL